MAVQVKQVTNMPRNSIVFRLDNKEFHQGFMDGKQYYVSDLNDIGDEPIKHGILTATFLMRQVTLRDKETGWFYFDGDELANLERTLGIFAGYLLAASSGRVVKQDSTNCETA